ncbi:MAG: hypothetical protein KC912_08140 [Proteobacteria bacterium]|nr:hypothetical protein [Pseudomonadota bacterium]
MLESAFILLALAAFGGGGAAYALTRKASERAHCQREVVPAIPHLLRFGAGQLRRQLADRHVITNHPETREAAERMVEVPGDVWFDGRTLAWDGPASAAAEAESALVGLQEALTRYVNKPWFDLAEAHGLAGDHKQLEGTVRGIGVRLGLTPRGRVRGSFHYGVDSVEIRHAAGPNTATIGDPILDVLHLHGDNLTSLRAEPLRTLLMEFVHGEGAEVVAGQVVIERPTSERTLLIQRFDALVDLACALRDRDGTQNR